jgi:predicted site-specific integrase-resolvase
MGALLTRKEAAARLGVSLVTLDAERSEGLLAYIQRRPGGKVWITEDAISEYLERMTHRAKPAIRLAGTTYRKRRA